ncbi:hypothetical protein [Cardinium endosymbiont of Tipula unca]|uniref:hypothetical protein n=1 Tax=Cardinium endosymbiont of Tipula unca TaxID=3066216 RepID=UPI0030D3B058
MAIKSEGKLSVNYLKGILGDKFNATLCAIGHNLRLNIRSCVLFKKQLKQEFGC